VRTCYKSSLYPKPFSTQIQLIPAPTLEELHIWEVPADGRWVRTQKLDAALTTDEIERSRRFRASRDRIRFVETRGWLRVLLGSYLGREPHEVQLVVGDTGKPGLRRELDGQLEFNVSHSGDFALVAFATGRRVGVDIEQMRPLDNLDGLARETLTDDEHFQFGRLPDEEKIAAFFRAWTRKEALIKATGEGLSRSMREIAAGIQRGIDPCGSTAVNGWQLINVPTAEGYMAAAAIEGGPWTMVRRCVTSFDRAD
jgi:4'-phosphopantetheinyl transferase